MSSRPTPTIARRIWAAAATLAGWRTAPSPQNYLVAFGWSMGGVIAQSLAVAHPEKVKHLVLVGTFVAPDGMLKKAITNGSMFGAQTCCEQVVRCVARLVCSPSLANDEATCEASIRALLKNPIASQ